MADAQHLVDLVEQAGWTGPGEFAEVAVQHLAIEEVQGVPAGGQGRHGVLLGLGDRLQELADLGHAHLPWMTFTVEQDEAHTPVGEGGYARLGMTPLPSGQAELVEQPRRRVRWRGRLQCAVGSGRVHDGFPPG